MTISAGRVRAAFSTLFAVALCLMPFVANAADTPEATLAKLQSQLSAMEKHFDELQTRLVRQEDIEKIRILAFSYGDYMDNALYDQVLAMFSPHMESCEISGYGVFKGLEGCRRLWNQGMGASYGGAQNQLAFGRFVKHFLVKDIIVVSSDGRTAHGRFDYMGTGGRYGDPNGVNQQFGVYNFEFVKENGVWMFSKFHVTFDAVNFNYRDWASNPIIRCPSPNAKADEPTTFFHPFPETGIIPFLDPNPVSGKPIPNYVNPTRFWQGNWPGEFGGACGKRADAPAPQSATAK
jgi:SnoaL-like domain